MVFCFVSFHFMIFLDYVYICLLTTHLYIEILLKILVNECFICWISMLFAENQLPNSNTSSSTNSSKTTSTTSVMSSWSSFKGDTAANASLKSFTLNDLKNATRNFRSESFLGEGGFGCVFKGWIDEHTLCPTRPGSGIVVAIKKLKRESFQGHKEWLVCIPTINHFLSFYFF